MDKKGKQSVCENLTKVKEIENVTKYAHINKSTLQIGTFQYDPLIPRQLSRDDKLLDLFNIRCSISEHAAHQGLIKNPESLYSVFKQ